MNLRGQKRKVSSVDRVFAGEITLRSKRQKVKGSFNEQQPSQKYQEIQNVLCSDQQRQQQREDEELLRLCLEKHKSLGHFLANSTLSTSEGAKEYGLKCGDISFASAITSLDTLGFFEQLKKRKPDFQPHVPRNTCNTSIDVLQQNHQHPYQKEQDTLSLCLAQFPSLRHFLFSAFLSCSETLLFHASKNDVQLVSSLIKAGANVNEINEKKGGSTCLIYAVTGGYDRGDIIAVEGWCEC